MAENFVSKKKKRKQEKIALSRARKSSSRPTKRAILFVVEGETEEIYLRNFFDIYSDHGLVDYTKLRIINPDCTDPDSVVDFAINYQASSTDFDDVFCVFDRDEYHINGAKFQSALQRVKDATKLEPRKSDSNLVLNSAPKLHALYSIPCFELWFLLRFSPTTKMYERAGEDSPADVLIRDLKTQSKFENYDKTNEANIFLVEHQDSDILRLTYENANQICRAAHETKADCPYITFHRLLDYLADGGDDFMRIY